MRHPLDILADSWKQSEEKELNIVEWESELRKKLVDIRVVLREREENAKKIMKETYYKMQRKGS